MSILSSMVVKLDSEKRPVLLIQDSYRFPAEDPLSLPNPADAFSNCHCRQLAISSSRLVNRDD
jgi:hypothetical protein